MFTKITSSNFLNHGLILLLFFCIFSCTEETNDRQENGPHNKSNIQLQKLDISDAKYLTISNSQAKSTTVEDIGLFKIDENGNISTVILTCTEGTDTIIRTHNEIKIIPERIIPLEGVYTMMTNCQFIDKDGQLINMTQYYEPESYGSFNILVQNSTGAIFYIPSSASEYCNEDIIHASDNNKNIYLANYEKLGLLTFQNNQLIIKQISPNGIQLHIHDEIWPLENETIVTHEKDYYTFLYPNGGFDNIENLNEEQSIYLGKTKNGIKAIKVEEISEELYTISFHDYNIGTSAGNISLSQPISSYRGNIHFAEGRKGNEIYETSKWYLLGSSFVVDKQTKEMKPLNEETKEHLIFPTEKNTYKGRAWRFRTTKSTEDFRTIYWFDIEELKYGEVQLDYSATETFLPIDSYENFPAGEIIITGIRYSDGKRIICTIDIETGVATCSEFENNNPITVLVPLN